MQGVGFEPTIPVGADLKSAALTNSANLACYGGSFRPDYY